MTAALPSRSRPLGTCAAWMAACVEIAEAQAMESLLDRALAQILTLIAPAGLVLWSGPAASEISSEHPPDPASSWTRTYPEELDLPRAWIESLQDQQQGILRIAAVDREDPLWQDGALACRQPQVVIGVPWRDASGCWGVIYLEDPQVDSQDLSELMERLQLLSTQLTLRLRQIWETQQHHHRSQYQTVRLNHLLDNSLVGIFRSRLEDGVFLEVNCHCLDLLGYSAAEQVVGIKRTVDFYDDPEDRQEILELLRQQGELHNRELRLRRRDGTRIWGLLSLHLNPEDNCVDGVLADISAIKRTQKVLEERTYYLQQITDHLPALIAYVDRQYRYRFASRGYEQWYGLPLNQILGQSLETLAGASHCRREIEQLQESMSGERVSMEILCQRADGQWRCLDLTLVPDLDAVGQVQGCFVLGLDITERKQAEAAQRASQAELQAVFNAMTDLVLVLDDQGRYLKIPSRDQSMLIRPASELLGQTLHEVLPQAEADRCLAAIHKTLTTQTSVSLEYSLCFSQAEEPRWFDATLSPLSETAVVCVVRDITQAKHSEIGLRQAEENYRSIFENSLEGIFQTSPEGHYLRANPALARIYGYDSPQDLMEHLIQIEVQLYVDPQRRRQFLEQLEQQGQIHSFESQVYRRDGAVIWISESARLLRDDQGQVLYYEGFVQDITRRKQTEAALRQQEEMLHLAMETGRMGAWELNILTNEERWTRENRLLFGVSEDLILSYETFVERVHPEDRERVIQIQRQALVQKQRYQSEFRILTPEGQVRWLACQGTYQYDEAGNPTRLVGITLDITERQRVEQALRESEERFRTLFENAPVGIYRITLGGEILLANPMMTQMMACASLGELQVWEWTWQVQPGTLSRSQLRQRVLQQGEVRGLEIAYTRSDGVVICVRENARLVGDAVGSPLYIEGTLEDITDRKRAEQALHRSEAQNRAIINAIPDLMIRISRSGEYLECVKLPETFRAYACPDVYVGKTVWEIMPVDLAALELTYIERAVQTQTSQVYEYTLELPEGPQYCEVRLVVCGPDQVLALIRDISDRKQAEREKETTLALLQATLDATADGILAVDPQGQVLTYNRQFLQMWDLCPEDMVYHSQERISRLAQKAQDPETFMDQIELFASSDQHSHDIIPLKDGRSLERYSQPQQIGEQRIGRVWSYRDITERQRIENALRESEARLQRALTAADMTAWDLDLVSGEERCWPEFCSIGGPVVCSPHYQIHPEDRERVQQLRAQAIQQGTDFQTEYRVVTTEGQIRWVASRGELQWGDQGPLRMLGASVDITERKQVEEALRLSEARYRQVIDTQTEYVHRCAPDYTITFCNEAFCRVLGRAQEQVVGTNLLDVVLAEEQERVRAHLLSLTPDHPLAVLEEQSRAPKGEICWRQWTAQALFDEEGRLLEYQCVGHDVTERRMAEEALRASETKFRNLFENSQVGIFRSGLENGELLDANQRLLEMFGYDTAEAVIRHLFEQETYVLDQQRQHLLSLLEDSGEAANIEIKLKRRDGGTLWVLLSARLNEEEACIEGILTDITERKLQEEALRLMVEETSTETGIEFFRACVHHMAEVLQVPYALVATFPEEDPFWIRVLAFWQRGAWIEQVEYPIPLGLSHPDTQADHLKHLCNSAPDLARLGITSCVSLPLTNTQGRPLGLLAVMDVKPIAPPSKISLILKIFAARAEAELERSQVEEDLRRAKEHAELANKAKSTFLANMSHELRTPMNAILGYSQLMARDRDLSSRQRESLEVINRSGEHLLNLINTVLELSKIEAGQMTIHKESFDLYQLLQIVQSLFTPRIESKALSLRVEIDPDVPQFIHTDQSKLRQVLINLLGNAVKFTHVGQIAIRVAYQQPLEDQHRLRFAVEDTGEGIEPQEMEHLFQPFMQTQRGTRVEGTGLGLSISRQFVHLLGGDIQVSSRPRQGSTFSFDIEIELCDPSAIAPTPPYRRVIGLAPRQPTFRLLVVDDMKENRDLLADLLSSVGFETLTADHGLEAIEAWQMWRPHLIWMDMRMPIMDGYEATRQIKSSPQGQSTVIIALTASSFDHERLRVLEAGCDDFVPKPFHEEMIFERISTHLGVSYIYEDSQLADLSLSTSAAVVLQPEDLQIMTSEWIAELQEAASHLDRDRVLTLLDQIPQRHEDLAEGLREWVSEFRFDRIAELAELAEGDGG